MPEAHIPRPPYYKKERFCLNPVVKHGIPKEADSRANPKVIGTAKWESWWMEQLHYICNGYTSGGITVPGRYYYYLNFNQMVGGGRIFAPDMVDLHLELAYLIEYAKKNGHDIICAKKRRAGISEFTQKAVVDYGYRFTNGGYRAGIAAGQEVYAMDFMKKLKESESYLPPELKTKALFTNKGGLIAGYKEKTEHGEVVGGTRNEIIVRTMYKSPGLFKGLPLNDVIAEECGEFNMLSQFHSKTLACVYDGDIKFGTFFLYGTGGNVTTAGKEFEMLWDEADQHNLIRFLITARRFHKPCYGGYKKDGEIAHEIPNLLKTHRPHEVVGVEDEDAAEEKILKQRAEILASGNTEKFQEHLRDYPFSKEDVFSLKVDNDFDSKTLNDQRNRISSEPKRYIRCRLDWKKDEKTGEILFPRQVELHYENNPKADCILIHQDHIKPLVGYVNLYIAGLDSYHQQKAKTSKSKGAMCVLIRANDIPGALQMAPVATICCRPERKEIFFDMCAKLALFFNLRESVLIDQANPAIFDWFEKLGFQGMLAYRPKKFESENSQQTGTFGVHLNNYSKPLMVSLMQSAILDYGDQIWFPELIQQLGNYNQVEIGSDNDLADAYGIALMQNVNEGIPARKDTYYTDKNIYQTPTWYTDANGNKVMRTENPVKLISDEQDVPGQFRSF